MSNQYMSAGHGGLSKMGASKEKLKRVDTCFDRIHTTLRCLYEHIESLDDKEVQALYNKLECGTLAPMRRLRLHLGIPYNWQEQPEAGNGRRDESSGGSVLCEEGA